MPDNVGNSLSSAKSISVRTTPQIFQDSVENTDVDYYRFSLSSRSAFTAVLSNLTDNANIYLRNQRGDIVVTGGQDISTNQGALTDVISTVLDPGTYYIQVSPGPAFNSANPTIFPSTNYNLSVYGQPGLSRNDIAGNTKPNAFAFGRLNGNGVYADRVGKDADTTDFYRFVVNSQTRVTLSLLGNAAGGSLSASLNLQLSNLAGTNIGTINTTGQASETLTSLLNPGTYYIRVAPSTTGGDSPYRLNLTVNNLPFLVTNQPLVLQEGASSTVGSSLLLVADENTPVNLRFLTITSLPTQGTLLLNGEAVVVGSSFTQYDVIRGKLQYRHDGSETAQDNFVFSFSDGTAESVKTGQTFNINVTATNDVPILSTNVGVTLSEGSSITFSSLNLLSTDPEQSNIALFYVLQKLPTGGTLLRGNQTLLSVGNRFSQADIDAGRVSYTHNGAESPRSDSFTFIVVDGSGGTAPSGVSPFSLRLLPANDAPVLVTQRGLTLSEGETRQITNTLLRATDPDVTVTPGGADQIIYTIAQGPQNGQLRRGTLVLADSDTFTQADIDNGRLSYTHDETETNSDSFTFTLTDGEDTGELQTFNIGINNVNFAPVLLSNRGATVSEGEVVVLGSDILLASDADNPSTELIYTLTSAPTAGEIQRNGTRLSLNQTFTQADIDTLQRITYRHGGSETLQDSFVFRLSDSGNQGISSQTFRINVLGVDDPPTITLNNPLVVDEGSNAVLNTSFLSATDPDSLPASLIYTLTSAPVNGVLIRSGQTLSAEGATFSQADLTNGQLRYQHDGSESTADSFVFQVGSSESNAVTQTFNISVTAINDAPRVSLNNPLTVGEGLSGAINNDFLLVTDNDGPSAVIYTVVGGPSSGTLSLGATPLSASATFTAADLASGQLTYVHNGNETPATDGFTFSATDGAGGNLLDTRFTIAITPSDDPPLLSAPAEGLTLNEDTTLTFSGANRISVTDAENQNLTVVLTVGAGTLAIGAGAGSTTLTLTGRPSTINSQLSSLVYKPSRDYNGTDELDIQLTDGGGNTIDDSVALTITPVNDAPTLIVTPTGARTVREDEPLVITGIAATDVDSGELPVRLTVTSNQNGTLTLGSATGSGTVTLEGTIDEIRTALNTLTYQGAPNFNGSDSLVITLDDQGNTGGTAGLIASRTIPINVTAVNDVPSFTVGEDITLNEDQPRQTLTGWATGLSKGADNESSQTLTFSLTADNNALFTSAGRPSINAAGDLTFQLAPNAFGTAVVTVTLRDSGNPIGTSAAQTFTINALPVNDAPVFTRTNNPITVNEDAGNVTRTIATGISAGPGETGQTVTFTVQENSNSELFLNQPTIDATGVLSFTAAPDASGTAIITVQAQDDGGTDNGGIDTTPTLQTYTINVRPVNDAPTLTLPSVISVAEEETVAITGTTVSDTDAGTGALQVILRALGPSGTASAGTLEFQTADGLSISGNRTSTITLTGTLAVLDAALTSFNYTGKPNISGTDLIQVTVNDQGNTGGGNQSASGTISVQVAAVNDAPSVIITGSTTRTATEDVLAPLTGITITDVDAGSSVIQVVLNSQKGAFALNPAGLTSAEGVGNPTVTLTGTIAALNTALGTLRYTGNPNFFSATPDDRDLVTVTVNDLGNIGTGGELADTKTLTIDVRPVNDLPELTLPTGPLSATEDVDFSFNAAAAISFTDVDSGETPIRVTLTVNNGKLTLTPTGLTTLSGANGTKTVTYEGTAAAIKEALATLVYRGNDNFNGNDLLTIRVNDKGATGATTSTDVVRSVSIAVASVNDPPVIVLNNALGVDEGFSGVIDRNLLRVSDPDSANPALITYSIVTAPNSATGTLLLTSAGGTTSVLGANGTFTQADIDAGRISYRQNGSEATDDSFVFRVSDGGDPLEGTFSIQINPIGDSPVLLSNQGLSLSEGAVSVISGTLLQVSDADTDLALLSYTVSAVPNTGSLIVNGQTLSSGGSFTQADINNGSVSYRHNGNETTGDSFSFSVADPEGGSSGRKVFQIGVIPVDDAPTLSTSPLSLSEGATITVTQSILRVSDADTAPTAIVYTVPFSTRSGTLFRSGVSLGDNATFTQDDVNNGRITYTHNGTEPESTPADFFLFQVNGLSGQRLLSINVAEDNDFPVLVGNPSGITVPLNTASTTALTSSQILVTDVDSTDAQITYTLNSVPTVGSLTKGSTTLGVGDSFSKQDLIDGLVRYEYGGTGGSNTSFRFRVSDSEGGTLPERSFNIRFTTP